MFPVLVSSSLSKICFGMAAEDMQTKAVCLKFRFGAKEDINLLKEGVAALSEKPFSRGTPAWNTVLLNLATNYAKWKPVTIRALRDRTHLLVKVHIRKENYSARQTGTSEDYNEMDGLLVSMRTLYESAADQQDELRKESLAEAKKKEEDRIVIKDMRESAMQRLANKRASSSASSPES